MIHFQTTYVLEEITGEIYLFLEPNEICAIKAPPQHFKDREPKKKNQLKEKNNEVKN